MLCLTNILQNLGKHLKTCLKIDKPIDTLATRMYRDGSIIFVSNGDQILPSNECDLDGFYYISNRLPVYETDGFGCLDDIIGYEITGYMILFGRRECETGWEGDLFQCLSKFKTKVGNNEATIKINGYGDDIPNIINSHFPQIKQQFQDAQPCTTLSKIDFKILINIC